MTKSIAYRPEIDGLRTLAVFAVIFHHFKLGFSGGFVGVDIFFVISGYLVGSIVLKQIDSGKFSLKSFAVRRLKRLYPALALVLLATTIASYFILMPPDFLAYAKTLAASLLASSNIYFWKTTNYFAGSSDFIPLLHTWSLSVEEQFYIGFPLLALLLAKLGKRASYLVFALLLVASLALCIWASYSIYGEANYYLLPTRAWEMLAGVMLAYGRLKLPDGFLPKLVALLLMVLPMFLYDQNTDFPGLYACIPVIGAVIFMSQKWDGNSILVKSFKSKPMVYFGKISYPLYLWHWPLVVLARHQFIPETLGLKLLLVIITIVLSILTYELVEKKLQGIDTKSRNSINKIFAGAAVMTCSAVAVALLIIKADGFWGRFPKEVRQAYHDTSATGWKRELNPKPFYSNNAQSKRGEFAMIGDPSEEVDFFLVGDSHGKSLLTLVNQMCAQYESAGYVALRDACLPVPNVYRKKAPRNLPYKSIVKNQILESKVKNVIIASNWTVYVKGNEGGARRNVNTEDGFGGDEEALDDLKKNMLLFIEELREAGLSVWIVNQVPNQEHEVPRLVAKASSKNLLNDLRGSSMGAYLERSGEVVNFINGLASDKVRIIQPEKVLFNGTESIIQIDGHPLYYDENHLTVIGANLLREQFSECFKTMSKN